MKIYDREKALKMLGALAVIVLLLGVVVGSATSGTLATTKTGTGGYAARDRADGAPDPGFGDIAGTGTEVPAIDWQATDVTASSDDEGFAGPYGIGFNFPFYDATYSQFWVHTNGYIAFEEPNVADFGGGVVGAPAAPNKFISVFWDDLNLGYTGCAACDGAGQGKVFYELRTDTLIINGSPVVTDVLQIQWGCPDPLACGGYAKRADREGGDLVGWFKVALYPSGLIKAVYHTSTGIGADKVSKSDAGLEGPESSPLDYLRWGKATLQDADWDVIEYFPPWLDLDGDELPDADEVGLYGTDPFNRDSDGDDLSDGFEVQYGTCANLDPNNNDTDGDGTWDKDEDPDGDGLTNLNEFRGEDGLDPWDPNDSDDDGIDDNFEYTHNCLDANTADSSDDWDLDGLTNLQE